MEKKYVIKILLSFLSLLLLITIIFWQNIKLEYFYRHYEAYGSYALTDEQINLHSYGVKELNLDFLKIKPEWNTKEIIKITDVIYYKEISQLSFGIITDKGSEFVNIEIVDKNQQKIGKMCSLGYNFFENKQFERLICNIEKPLTKNEIYTIRLWNKKINFSNKLQINQ